MTITRPRSLAAPISEELTRSHHAGGLVTIVRVQWLGKAGRTVTRRLQGYY